MPQFSLKKKIDILRKKKVNPIVRLVFNIVKYRCLSFNNNNKRTKNEAMRMSLSKGVIESK